MRKYLFSLLTIAIFAIGFAASDSPDGTLFDALGESVQSNTNNDESTDYEQSEDSESSYVSFGNEQDVRTYLCIHRFTSSDDYTISFSNNANEVSVNGRPLSSAVDIYVSSSSSATIRTHGPYGNTTFRLSVSGDDGVLVDADGETYYSN